ncbi:major facilitator superfamily domain-containing protein [Fimicolochytrium jonesii]|uniref:major facilitator superfamily domain-containing protein n=1 Tax=Fimicolochytrium jonesii TaxID=1396493 RepID=UPI0022FF2B28|nr:major facilitator superfamily domain-containing protein [Fimicolochytrium jonesii]KAI8815656.1 major facilitator superfamily domain-containing protein [Fimicolochytrium jonesii]
MWLQGVALILPHVQSQYSISDQHIGFLSSSVFAGMFAGAVFWGFWSDKRGRKDAFNYTLAISAVFGLAAAVAPGFTPLCALMFALGFGVGGHMPVDGCLFIEFCPVEKRSYLTLLSVFFSLGSVVASGLGVAVFWNCGDKCPGTWRWLVAILGIISLVMLAGRIFFFDLKESPKFLLSQKDHQGVVIVLDHLVRANANRPESDDVHFTLDEVKGMKAETMDGLEHAGKSGLEIIRQLCVDEKYSTTTLLLLAIWALLNLGFTMFNAFIAKFIASKGLATTSPSSIYIDCLIYAAASIPASIAASYLIDLPFLGRRGTMLGSMMGTALMLTAFTVVEQRAAVLMSSAAINGMASVAYAALYTYTPEVFPTDVRTTANGGCSAVGRITGILAPMLGGFFFSISPNTTIFFSAATLCASGICCALLPIETRPGEPRTEGRNT